MDRTAGDHRVACVDIANPANREVVRIARQLPGDCRDFPGGRRHANDCRWRAARLQGHGGSAAARRFRLIEAGFVGSWVLAFPLGYGPVGLWLGLALGLAVVAALPDLAAASGRVPARPWQAEQWRCDNPDEAM